MKSLFKLIFQKRFLIILILGFASGLPLGIIGSTLQAWYTVEGVDLVTIGLLALVGQPYVYKFLWAPVIDKYQPLSFLFMGQRRSWMLITQCALVLTLIIMAFFKPSTTPMTLALLALGLAFLSATQDIAIDAYRTEILLPEERGAGAAMSVAGYRIAMLVSGGLSLIFAEYLGFKATFLLMAACMIMGIIATLKAEEPVMEEKPSLTFRQACLFPLNEFLTRKNALALLLLIVLYKLGDAFAGSLTTTFLLRGVGFSLLDVGLVNKTLGLAGSLLGVFCGGIILSRMRLFKALLGFGIVQAMSNLTYLFLTWGPLNYTLMGGAVFLENFGGGLGTAAFCALLMSLCNKRYIATQFALLSALAAIGRVFVGPAAGFWVERFGWSDFFIGSVAVSIPGLILLWVLRGNLDPDTSLQDEALSDVVA